MRWSLPLFLLFSGGVILFSCKKPVIGENGTVPKNNLGVEFTDTLTVRAYNVREDSLEGDNQSLNILGSMEDPLFGKSYASIYSQFALPIDNLYLGSGIVVDSTVLCIAYAGSYGDIRTPMNIRVYQVNETFYVDSIYYTNRVFQVKPTLVGSLSNFVPNLTDSIYLDPNKLDYDTLAHAPEMRIRINNNLAVKYITSQSGGPFVVDNPTFQAFFNGLYITTDTTKPGKGMVYLNMGSSDSHLSIYYRDTVPGTTSSTTVDTVVYFYSNSLAKIVEHFQHNYNGAPVAKYLNSNNPNGDSLLFTQSMASVKGKIYVPYLQKLVQQVGGMAINKAELVFSAIGDSSTYTTPLEITLNTLNSSGMDTSIADAAIGADYFGGYKTSAITRYNVNTQYGLNLSRYYQGIAEGGIDSGLYVFPFPPNRIADRVLFGGSGGSPGHPIYNNSAYRIRLNLTYTKIKL